MERFWYKQPLPSPPPPLKAPLLQVFAILLEVVSPTDQQYLRSPLLPVFSSFSKLKGKEKVQPSHARIVPVCSPRAHALHLSQYRRPSLASRSETSCASFKAAGCLPSAVPMHASRCHYCCSCVTPHPGTSSSLDLSPRPPAHKACRGLSVSKTLIFQTKLSPLFRLPPSPARSHRLVFLFLSQLIEGENSRTLQPLLKREVHKNFD